MEKKKEKVDDRMLYTTVKDKKILVFKSKKNRFTDNENTKLCKNKEPLGYHQNKRKKNVVDVRKKQNVFGIKKKDDLKSNKE